MLRVALVTLLALAAPAGSGTIELPTPDAARVQQDQLIRAVGGRPDRLLASDVPGRVVNDEVIRVGVAGDGGIRAVTAEQRLELLGEGDYAIRERGPARSAQSLSDEPPPVTRRGAVVWQGFSPGRRDLAARLVLDPLIEAQHLPLTVQVAFTGADGRPAPVGDGGRVPAAGTVQVTVRNVSTQPATLPTASDVSAALLASPLDRALAVARRPTAARLPSTDDGLPATLAVTGGARVQTSQQVPFHLTGSLRVTGATATVTGPATTATVDGANFAGTLSGDQSVTFTAQVDGPGRLALSMTAVAALDPRALAPPGGGTWRAWAAAGPPATERKAALDLLIEVAATGARASSYSPYLGADLEGSGSTTYSYGFAPAAAVVAAPEALHPRWGRIALVGVALLLLLTNAGLIWRRS